MGVDLHITRADFWAMNDDAQISEDEWIAYVATDAELRLAPKLGPKMVRWVPQTAPGSRYADPWLEWSQGNVSTKWPDTVLYRKMLKIAAALGAHVQDDDGHPYVSETDWEFEPEQ
jgi:hypothetical protein